MRNSVLTVIVVTIIASIASSAEPLHKRIDGLIDQKIKGQPTASQSDDAEFVRRVYLDLAGRIPTAVEARSFFADMFVGKRAALIDRLLKGADYPRRMHELFHVMLMERRGEHEEWSKFLRNAFEKNMPWHELARAILRPNADIEDQRGAAFFFTQRLVKEGAMAPVDIPGLTRDVGRLIAGVDLQCCQCHDHLTVPTYKQKHFQGLHMIFENVQTRRDVKFPAISEKIMTTKKEFKSVFEQVAIKTGPVIPGRGELEIKVFKKGEEYAVPPDTKKRTPGLPQFSPLGELSAGLANSDNKLFRQNIANRLWFLMMGRGLVEPLDLLHSENPPTHPELLELLASEFAAHDFDMRWLLREIALSNAYQRSSVLADAKDRHSYAGANEKRLSAEQLFWSLGVATGEFEAQRQKLREVAVNNKTPASDSKRIDTYSFEELVEKSTELQELSKLVTDTFANSPKEPEVDFTPTVKGALFMMHEQRIQDLVAARPGNLTNHLASTKDVTVIVDEMFLHILSRKPTDEERAHSTEYLEQRGDRLPGAISNLAWAMLTSTEFAVNH